MQLFQCDNQRGLPPLLRTIIVTQTLILRTIGRCCDPSSLCDQSDPRDILDLQDPLISAWEISPTLQVLWEWETTFATIVKCNNTQIPSAKIRSGHAPGPTKHPGPKSFRPTNMSFVNFQPTLTILSVFGARMCVEFHYMCNRVLYIGVFLHGGKHRAMNHIERVVSGETTLWLNHIWPHVRLSPLI